MLDEERRGLIEEACGVFGLVSNAEAANLTYLGLHALQHRGQEAAGISTLDGDEIHTQRRLGLVSEAFTHEVLSKLPGDASIGHVRYSTTGESAIRNAQPISVSTKFGPISLAHNGNLTNASVLRSQLESQGSIFGTSTDTEVIAHLVARSFAADMRAAITDALRQVKGAFSLVALTTEFLVCARDPYGVRPLVLGSLDGNPVVASEPSSFKLIGADYTRDIEPGEMVVIPRDGTNIESLRPFESVKPRPCIFELVYFSRPDNVIFGCDVYNSRKEMGRTLARESHTEADVVIPVPDSGVPAAMGYAAESGVPFELGLVRSHYVGRTFIEPSSQIRHFGVKLKLSPIDSLIRDKRVVVVDDSIVRGTTCKKIIQMVREAGAREVHFRVASPPTTHSCFYGIDTPRREQLIASKHSTEAIAAYIDADSLAYLSIEGLRRSVGAGPDEPAFCEACFTGEYPITLEDKEFRETSGRDA